MRSQRGVNACDYNQEIGERCRDSRDVDEGEEESIEGEKIGRT